MFNWAYGLRGLESEVMERRRAHIFIRKQVVDRHIGNNGHLLKPQDLIPVI